MRYFLVVASALAIGAIAGAIEKRVLIAEPHLEMQTVTVYVTASATKPTAVAKYTSVRLWDPFGWKSKPSSSPSPKPSSSQIVTKPLVPTITSRPTPIPGAPVLAPSAPSNAGSHLTGDIQANLSSGPYYQAAVLYHHNAARANHGAFPLVWDAGCEAGARRTAQTCKFEHPKFLRELRQGQNLFTVSGDFFNVTAGITESWYKGEFDAMNPYWGAADIPDDVFPSVGHLTAIVWKKTTKVGCVSLNCGNTMTSGGQPTILNKFTVCNYAPAGNVRGRYAENVGLPIDRRNLGSWTD